MSLRYFLFLNNYLLERSRLFSACSFWLWLPASEQDLRGSVSKFRLAAAGPSALGKWTHLALLTKGSERERTRGGENVFLKHFSLCLLRIDLVEPHSSRAANCPIGSNRAHRASFPSVSSWNSHRGPRATPLKVLDLVRVCALSVGNLLLSESVFSESQ